MTLEELKSLLTQADEEQNKVNYDQAEKLANEVLAVLEEPHLNPPPKGRLSFSFPFGECRDGVLVERGEMHIKGKGMMKTYYLQKANL